MKTTQHHLAASSPEARADQEPQAMLRIELEYDDGEGPCEIICRGTEMHMRMLDARLKFLHRLEQQSCVAEVVEKIAKEWDGCMAPMFDPAGNPTDPLDIGATIRDAHGVKACNFPDCFCDGPMDERCKNNRAAGTKESA